jgi:hypothetical protein
MKAALSHFGHVLVTASTVFVIAVPFAVLGFVAGYDMTSKACVAIIRSK